MWSYIKQTTKKYDFFKILFVSIVFAVSIYFFDYYHIASKYFNEYKIICIGMLIILVSYILKEKYIKKIYILFKDPINDIDFMLHCTSFSISILLIFYLITILIADLQIYKIIVLLSMLFINISLMLLRKHLFNKYLTNKNNVKKSFKTYSLIDLYTNNILNNKESIIINENPIIDSNNDLMETSLFVENIENIIKNYKCNESISIGLIGKWGSGKSTIINFLKEKLSKCNDISVELFSPWKYEDKRAMLKGFMECISKVSGQSYGNFEYKKLLNQYLKILSSFEFDKFNIKFNDFFKKSTNDVETIKQKIEMYLESANKKIVIVVDDIDRLSKEEMLFTFKTVKSLFDFKNIIYVLSYDEEQVKNVFERWLKYSPEYVDKIVQSKIYVPIVDSGLLTKITNVCIKNLLNIYNVQINDEARYKRNIHNICARMKTFREVIRFINSISITINNCKEFNLDVCDYICIRYIEFVDYRIYNAIYNNPEILLSTDGIQRSSNTGMIFQGNGSINNSEQKDKFINNLTADINLKNIINDIFPDIIQKGTKGLMAINKEKREIFKMRRCCNGNCFYSYFYLKNDTYSKMTKIVDDFIYSINNGKSYEETFDDNKEKIIVDHKIFSYILVSKIENIINLKKALIFFVNSNFFEFYEKVNILSAIICCEKEENNISKYVDYLFDNIQYKMYESIITNVANEWCNSQVENKLKETINSKIKTIFIKKIDIFKANNYVNGTCKFLYNNTTNKEKLKSYISDILSGDNVFKLIGEAVVEINGGEAYMFKDENLECFVNRAKVFKIIEKINKESLNNDQMMILKLYNNKNKEINNIKIDFNNL